MYVCMNVCIYVQGYICHYFSVYVHFLQTELYNIFIS